MFISEVKLRLLKITNFIDDEKIFDFIFWGFNNLEFLNGDSDNTLYSQSAISKLMEYLAW